MLRLTRSVLRGLALIGRLRQRDLAVIERLRALCVYVYVCVCVCVCACVRLCVCDVCVLSVCRALELSEEIHKKFGDQLNG